MDPVRVLYVNGGRMDFGGISTVMMNYFKHIDSRSVRIDFLVHGNVRGERDDEITDHGSCVYYVPTKSENLIGNYRKIKQILTDGQYQIVHAHADGGNAYILRIAKICNVDIRISHSHSTDFVTEKRIHVLANQIQKRFIRKYATNLWACSKAAGRWLYEKSSFDVIPNAVEVERYLFSEQDRAAVRNKYKLDDHYVVGIVGHLASMKNHKFILNVLKMIKIKNGSFRLLIVGDGVLKETLHQHVRELKLENYVIFTGNVNRTECVYSALDLLVMPSLFEGFPMVALEAQCNGLPCLLSTEITDEVKVLDTVEFLDLTEEIWVDGILKKMRKVRRTTDVMPFFQKRGYDIKYAAECLQTRYIHLAENCQKRVC